MAKAYGTSGRKGKCCKGFGAKPVRRDHLEKKGVDGRWM
jgi:hypothetical protein